jgi:hypothetical protein
MKILIALLLLSLPSFAQVPVVFSRDSDPTSGTLTTITTDTVAVALSGTRWATAKFSVTTAGTATATAQISIDGGFNYFASAYAKRLSTISANPTVQAISATTLVTGDVWEVPLPGNATHFRLLCGGTGTVTTVSLSGGLPYVPGVPVTAVLYDVTSATNTALISPIFDVSGWTWEFHTFTSSGGAPSFQINNFDDAGATFVNDYTSNVANYFGGLGPGLAHTTNTAASFGAPLPKRVRFNSAAIAAQTSRIRSEVRR